MDRLCALTVKQMGRWIGCVDWWNNGRMVRWIVEWMDV